jgi:hypothetical protein
VHVALRNEGGTFFTRDAGTVLLKSYIQGSVSNIVQSQLLIPNRFDLLFVIKIKKEFSMTKGLVAIFMFALSFQAMASKNVTTDYQPEEKENIERPNRGGILTCRWNGQNYQPMNTRNGEFIGKPGYGFRYLNGCEKVVFGSTRHAVCQWNGKNYQPYGVRRNVAIGKVDYGFSNIDSCIQTVQASRRGRAVCQWNGQNYQPHFAVSGKAIGKVDYGFKTFQGCLRTAQAANNGFVCQWNGQNNQAYHMRSNKAVGKTDYGFKYLDGCLKTTRHSARDEICNWDGKGYTIYAFPGNKEFGRFRDLQRCFDRLAF